MSALDEGYSGYDHDDLADWPTAPKTIEAIRSIFADHSAKMIDGVMVDAMTANAIVVVYDALKPENRERMMDMDIAKIGRIAWKCVR